MKIFLGNSPWRKKGFYGVRAGSRWPHFERDESGYRPFPFFLAYAAAVLEKDGQDVCLVDGIAEDLTPEQFLDRVVEFKPDLVLLEVSTSSSKVDEQMGRQIKERLPETRLAYSGLNVFMYSPKFLEETPYVDYVLEGEYEYTLRDLVRGLSDKKDLSDCLGLYFRKDGAGFYAGKRPLISDLDQLPWPSREQLPMMKYHDCPGGIPEPSLQIHSSRGCPFQCNFCAWPQIMYGDHSYRVRDPKDVVDEIAWCKEKYGYKSFYVDDDTFNIGKPRLLKFAEELKKREICLPWAAMARADTCDFDTLEKLRDAGLVAIKYGVESGDQDIVDQMKKNLDLDTLRKAVKRSKELGLKVHLTFTYGHPGETWASAEKTTKLALELNPDSLQFSIATPYPGSRLFEELEKSGNLLTKDWDLYDGYNNAVTRTDELGPEDIVKILRDAEKRFARQRFLRSFQGAELLQTAGKFVKHPTRALRRLKTYLTEGRF